MKVPKPMSDKEFDMMFHEKLYSFETEPTDAVWIDIAEKLDGTANEKSFPILRIAAACLAAVVGLGIWLASHNQPMKLNAALPNNEGIEVKETTVVPLQDEHPAQAANAKDNSRHLVKQLNVVVVKRKTDNKAKVALSNAYVSRKEIVKAVKKSEIESPIAQVEVEVPIASTTPLTTLAIASEPVGDNEETTLQKKTSRIKSVGSLVNFVISKVDKRNNKIIEFEDGDEGTVVSGVNLGLLKFKAKE